MPETSTEGIEREETRRSGRLNGVGWGLAALGLFGAFVNAFSLGSASIQLGALLLHGIVLASGAAILARRKGSVFAITLWFVIVLACFPALPRTLPERRETAYHVHLVVGFVGVLTALWASGALLQQSRWRRWGLGAALLGILSAPAVASVVRDWRTQHWEAPPYRDSTWRFLTATSSEQTQSPLFPSALNRPVSSAASCVSGDCHRGNSCRLGEQHAGAGSSDAYLAAFADFTQRKGAESANWCKGCHATFAPNGGSLYWPRSKAPRGRIDSMQGVHSTQTSDLNCRSCHDAVDVHSGAGSAALTLAGRRDDSSPFLAQWRPRRHNASMLRPMHRSAEFCGACHRKNWSLPQNEFRFVPGQDEFRQWSESRFAEGALLAPGEAAPARSCLSCHGNRAPKKQAPPLSLDAFLRSASSQDPPVPADRSAPRPGERCYLDVVIHNSGIGHDFPTGMPDQREAWLEVRIRDTRGKLLLSSEERAGEKRHLYRLVGLDREGKRIAHGDLDRMVRTSEWRRIPAGGSDLARYAFTVPPGGIGTVDVRLRRGPNREFARWTQVAVGQDEVIASLGFKVGESKSKSKSESESEAGGETRWRRYAEALAAVKAYPFAVQAMQQSLAIRPRAVESLIGLGRIFLSEGDVLSAQDQLRLARDAAAGDPRQSERVAAWLAAALRTAQPAQAVESLTPLVERYPRDLRLRFELGRALMDLLRNREAAAQFQSMLDIDPLDSTAHYNLMLCYQRLNLLSEARREEVVYRLMAPDTESTLGTEALPSKATEAQPLHVHTLEAHP